MLSALAVCQGSMPCNSSLHPAPLLVLPLLQSGSVAAMSEVWGKGEHVQCIHPLAGCIAGRQAVRALLAPLALRDTGCCACRP